jgi:hypothetical protein
MHTGIYRIQQNGEHNVFLCADNDTLEEVGLYRPLGRRTMRKNAKAANFSLLAVLACMMVMSMAAETWASGPSNQVIPGTVPGAPTEVTATPGNGQATVSFKLPTNGTIPITNCTVTSNPGGITVTDSGNPITISGLTNGTPYTFTVKATNAVGTGPASSPSKAVTPATVPGAPTGVTAKAGNASATVSFTAPVSDGGSPIASYIVTSSPGGITASGSRSPIIVKGLTNGTSYTFTVQAINKIGTGPPDQAPPTK